MPAQRAVVDLVEMPARGFCEQTISQAAIRALNALVKVLVEFTSSVLSNSLVSTGAPKVPWSDCARERDQILRASHPRSQQKSK